MHFATRAEVRRIPGSRHSARSGMTEEEFRGLELR